MFASFMVTLIPALVVYAIGVFIAYLIWGNSDSRNA